MKCSRTLLSDYAEHGSEAAFKELVTSYLDLVYATAFRLLGGDRLLAEDVAQTVFIDLARRARTLSKEVMLGGWLHRRTCHVATTLRRAEHRRKLREQKAVEMNPPAEPTDANLAELIPIVDEAVERLGTQDRAAILLRFFEQKDFRAVGAALGCNEDAARMRVNRALEKLHAVFRRKGVLIPAGTLAGALHTQALTGAPAGLSATISAVALGSAAAHSGFALTFTKLMTVSKIKLGLAGALVLTAAVAPLVVQRRAQSQIEKQAGAFEQELARLKIQSEGFSNRLAQAEGAQRLAQEQMAELMRLRSEVGELRHVQKTLEDLHAAADAAKASGAAPTPPAVNDPTNVILKADWRFAGFATPEAALQSMLWAMRDGDAKFYLASLAPEAQQKASERLAGKSEAEIEALLKKDLEGFEGLRFQRKVPSAPDRVTFMLAYHESDNGLAKMHDESIVTFKHIGGEWKCTE